MIDSKYKDKLMKYSKYNREGHLIYTFGTPSVRGRYMIAYTYNGRSYNNPAARLSYMLHHDLAPLDIQGDFVCHIRECDEPNCVLPSHLYLGSSSDNARDDVVKGVHSGQKLTLQDADEIRDLYTKGYRQREIASMFGVSRSHVSAIIAGKHLSKKEQ